MQHLLTMAIVAIECENSLWQAQQMPDYGSKLRPQKRLGGQLGLKKSAVLPTVIIKKEDLAPLIDWQRRHQVPIHIWHAFYDIAFGIALDRAGELIAQGLIEPTEQVFQAPGGATSKKIMYKIYYHHAYQLGYSAETPRLVAHSITDKNGHILPYVAFEGGRLHLDDEALTVLNQLAS